MGRVDYKSLNVNFICSHKDQKETYIDRVNKIKIGISFTNDDAISPEKMLNNIDKYIRKNYDQRLFKIEDDNSRVERTEGCASSANGSSNPGEKNRIYMPYEATLSGVALYISDFLIKIARSGGYHLISVSLYSKEGYKGVFKMND